MHTLSVLSPLRFASAPVWGLSRCAVESVARGPNPGTTGAGVCGKLGTGKGDGLSRCAEQKGSRRLTRAFGCWRCHLVGLQCCQGYGVACVTGEQISKCCGCCEGNWVGNCCEAIFCLGCHVSSSRIWIQEERQITTDPCDNRLIRLSNCLQILAFVCNILAICFPELQDRSLPFRTAKI